MSTGFKLLSGFAEHNTFTFALLTLNRSSSFNCYIVSSHSPFIRSRKVWAFAWGSAFLITIQSSILSFEDAGIRRACSYLCGSSEPRCTHPVPWESRRMRQSCTSLPLRRRDTRTLRGCERVDTTVRGLSTKTLPSSENGPVLYVTLLPASLPSFSVVGHSTVALFQASIECARQ